MDAPDICIIRDLRRSEKPIISFIASLITGILSGWGIGGGTLLIVFMTAIQGLSHSDARGVNLIYFLPTSSAALYSHIKNRLIDKKAFIIAGICGILSALITSAFSSHINSKVLKVMFGIFLIYIGVREFLRKDNN
ncbi:MAG: sulfite exporter TauE/SafE family protein [Oscillospiraceae bacterium]|nr:sulfite exporter TauE/SafE family protein [Oscillospiraceae bacterium]